MRIKGAGNKNNHKKVNEQKEKKQSMKHTDDVSKANKKNKEQKTKREQIYRCGLNISEKQKERE